MVEHPIIRYGKHFNLHELNRNISWRVDVAREQKLLSKKLANHRETICNCPICQCENSSLYVEVFGYPYLQCEKCRHIYLSTPVSEFATAELYSGQSENKCVQDKIYLVPGIFEKRLNAIAYPKVDYVIETLAATARKLSGRWIDIGCGTGEVIVAAQKRGWNVLGVESDYAEALFARQQGVEVINEYINEENADGILKNAAIISLFNVLEHIRNPTEFVALLSKNLGDGLLVFEVPRYPSISSLNTQMFPEMACRHIYPPDHLHIFTDVSVKKMISEANLEIVAVWYFGQDYSDLLHSAAANQSVKDVALWQSAVDLQSAIQEIIDHAGLSDTMVIIAKINVKG
jgi:2-polyprenyl-3-methyl-5-hydroxy-6-metoxy-1,4-benzoquinol methylase